MNSEDISVISLEPFICKFVFAIIKTIQSHNFSYDEKQVIHADLVPRVSEKTMTSFLNARRVPSAKNGVEELKYHIDGSIAKTTFDNHVPKFLPSISDIEERVHPSPASQPINRPVFSQLEPSAERQASPQTFHPREQLSVPPTPHIDKPMLLPPIPKPIKESISLHQVLRPIERQASPQTFHPREQVPVPPTPHIEKPTFSKPSFPIIEGEVFSTPTSPLSGPKFLPPTPHIEKLTISPPPHLQRPVVSQSLHSQIHFVNPNIMAPRVNEETNFSQDYGRVAPLLDDPVISLIECHGAGKPLMIIRAGQKQITRIILSPEEIKEILQDVSDEAHVPLLEGVFRAVVGNFSINAIISDMVGSRFVIRKQTPYSLIERQI